MTGEPRGATQTGWRFRCKPDPPADVSPCFNRLSLTACKHTPLLSICYYPVLLGPAAGRGAKRGSEAGDSRD